MDSLEKRLRDELRNELYRINNIQRSLSAEITVEPEEGHWERGGPNYGKEWEDEGRSWVVDKAEVTTPALKERQEAKDTLQQVYDSSSWYTSRYYAQKTHAVTSSETNQLEQWIAELKEELRSMSTVRVVKDGQGNLADIRGEPFPSRGKRLKAAIDLANLYSITRKNRNPKESDIYSVLQEAYQFNEVKEVRTAAGQALGYSGVKIFFHNLFHG